VQAVAVRAGRGAAPREVSRTIVAGDADAATRWLEACRDYHVSDGTLEQLGTQLTALQHAQASHAEELQALQRQFTQHLASGALLEPADENALANYRRLKALDPANAALPTMLHSLALAVTADVQARVARNDLAGADQRLHAALDAGLDGEELAGAAAALERVQAVATPEVIPEARLQRAHFVAPVYPPDALARRLSGSVELEFTVTPHG
jgi:hypothetical protein